MITDANGMPVLQPLVDNASTATFNAAFAQIGTVVGGQQIKTYKWANAAARTSQTGMGAGDFGYQSDTQFLYIYSGGVWQSQGPVHNPSGAITPASGYSFAVNSIHRSGNTISLYVNVAKLSSGNWGGTHVIGSISPGLFDTTRDVIGSYWGPGGSGPLRVATNGNVLLYETPNVVNSTAYLGTATWVIPA